MKNCNGDKGYHPRKDQARLLDLAFQIVRSVPYGVTARWLFYRLLQEGCFASKEDYKGRFLPLIAKARKSFYNGWTPDTLADDTRPAVIRGDGFLSETHFLQAVGDAECILDKRQTQPYYCELWFEAKAMRGQFEHYTDHITLRPFGGDPSIYAKWAIAQELTAALEKYGKPIVILYFGDLDPKGLQIPKSAVKDIRRWTRTTGFEFVRCGLNPGDEVTYGIPENPEKPGTYQWEALNDEAAKQIILDWTGRFVSQGAFSATEALESEITGRFQERYAEFLESSR